MIKLAEYRITKILIKPALEILIEPYEVNPDECNV